VSETRPLEAAGAATPASSPTSPPLASPAAAIIPEAVASPQAAGPIPAGAATVSATVTVAAGSAAGQTGDLWNGRRRWCVSLTGGPSASYDLSPLRLGWYMDWTARRGSAGPAGSEYAPMVGLSAGKLDPDAQTIANMARAHPGLVWLIGNEPDVKWQDNVDAATYARLYHEAYTALKSADPTAQVSIGSISEPTPLRLRYLDGVLAAYREQFGAPAPVEVWNIHNYMLREERGSWGVDIPPGMADQKGQLYQIADSGNLALFKQQIVAFRRWMAERGYQDRPLLITEYGIPMPPDYGFPPDKVIAFWTEAFDYFRSATDPGLGLPADQQRLVQAWCWFSLSDSDYMTGNLYDPQTHAMTSLGQTWAAYVARVP
jgi:hypothetical protein